VTLSSVAIKGYRSIRKLYLPLRQLTVLIGGNGVGKTNLYRSIELLHAAANGNVAHELAREGGLGSVFWAGGKNLTADGSFDPKYRTNGYRTWETSRLELEVRLEIEDYLAAYGIELGFPTPNDAAFPGEALVKKEFVESSEGRRTVRVMERNNGMVWTRDGKGGREVAPHRTFFAHELSDGTLQFLALMGALLSYRLPSFIALNEPETSLHPSLLPALAQTIVKAAERAQVWVVTHSQQLADEISQRSGTAPFEVIRTAEGTSIEGLNALGQFADD